jgi:cytochrome P450
LAADENGESFSDDDIVNHMIFLMMAAHDTSTLTLCSLFYYLAKYPHWQQRLREESITLGKRAITHADLTQLPLLDSAMKESLRLIPPVHGIPRRTVKDVRFEGITIPAGTFIIISPYVSHHMTQWWESPEQFDPERFTTSQEHKKHPYQYIPFGGGAHKCIGLHFADLQVKAILHQVLLQFRWSVPKHYDMPINFTTLPTPRDGLPIRITRLQP